MGQPQSWAYFIGVLWGSGKCKDPGKKGRRKCEREGKLPIWYEMLLILTKHWKLTISPTRMKKSSKMLPFGAMVWITVFLLQNTRCTIWHFLHYSWGNRCLSKQGIAYDPTHSYLGILKYLYTWNSATHLSFFFCLQNVLFFNLFHYLMPMLILEQTLFFSSYLPILPLTLLPKRGKWPIIWYNQHNRCL